MKVLVFLAEGFEEIEALTCIDVLRRGNVRVDSVSINNNKTVKGAHNIVVECDFTKDEINPDYYDMVVLPGGGLGTENLKNSDIVDSVLKSFIKEDKFVTAICAAPSVLGVKGYLQGKKAICYPGFEGELKGAVVTDEKVVTDGKIITSKGPGTAMDFALTLLEVIKGSEAKNSVKNGMLI